MQPISINRTTVPVEGMFPMIRDFPAYGNPDPNIAVLMRLFTQANYAPLAQNFMPMILWSMRSLILNSDMRDYKPSLVFHCDQRLYDMGKEVFEESGVPEECIVVYDPDIVPTILDKPIMHLAAAPLLDPQLERFKRVIVLDGDLFALGNADIGYLPIMDVSLNKMPNHDIALLRSWTKWNPIRDEYKNWYDHGQREKEGFLEKAATYCNTTPDVIDSIMYPDDLEAKPRPFHNGAYISIPMPWLVANTEFREFIREASGTMGNEEIAMAIWGMKRYLETGERWPENNIQDFSIQAGTIKFNWDLDETWHDFEAGRSTWAHLYSYDNILTYGLEWAKAIGGSESEAHELYNNIQKKVSECYPEAQELHDNNQKRVRKVNMLEFQPFPLRDTDKSKQVAKDIEAICFKVAQDNRGVEDGAYVVQHSQNELQALYEVVGRMHDPVQIEGNVLQCGIFCGGSAFMMAHALRDDDTATAPMLAIDSYTKDYRPLRELFDDAYFEYRENLWEFRLHEHITAVQSDTVSFLAHFWNLPLRVVFIDSSHHYEPTLNELNLILPHLVDGGWLVLHDYFSDDTPGVARAVNETFESKDLSQFKFYRIDGLTIIHVRSTGLQSDSDNPTPAKLPFQHR